MPSDDARPPCQIRQRQRAFAVDEDVGGEVGRGIELEITFYSTVSRVELIQAVLKMHNTNWASYQYARVPSVGLAQPTISCRT
jgi:hypothetical protein